MPDAPGRPAEHACSGWASTPSGWAAVLNRIGEFYLRLRQGRDRRRPRPARRLRHLGRRGLQEGHVHVARLLARPLQALGRGRSSTVPTPTACRCIYHGCGNVQAIFEDFIEIGIDAYNPLEAKAGMDAVDLRRRYRPPARLLRQQRRPGLGTRRPRRPSAARSSASSTRPRAAD